MTWDFSTAFFAAGAGVLLAVVLGWAARERARVHRAWARHRRVADSFVAAPAIDWISLEAALGWL